MTRTGNRDLFPSKRARISLLTLLKIASAVAILVLTSLHVFARSLHTKLLEAHQATNVSPKHTTSLWNAKRHYDLSSAQNRSASLPLLSRSSSRKPRAAWKDSKHVPQWMKDYFQWHQEARQTIRATKNWQQFDYLVFRCLEHDDKCGGAADRLKPLPFVLLVASKLQPKRLVFYKWERPAALEHFLIPPNHEGALDWRWPPHPSLDNFTFSSKIDLDQRKIRHAFGLHPADGVVHPQPFYEMKNLPKIATFRFQSTNHGQKEYNQLRTNNETEADYATVFRDCWNSVFSPSPPVQQQIQETMQQLNLVTNSFHAIHIRSQYHKKFSPTHLVDLTHNAVNCLYSFLSQRGIPLTAETPVFVASDSRRANQMAVQYAQSRGLQHVESRVPRNATLSKDEDNNDNEDEDDPTLHLDRGKSFVNHRASSWTRHEPHEYFSTFVDMYILSQAQCMVFNVGNYGKWANLLSSDPTCEYSHMKDKACVFPADAFAQQQQ